MVQDLLVAERSRSVVAQFDGGRITSHAGGLILREETGGLGC